MFSGCWGVQKSLSEKQNSICNARKQLHTYTSTRLSQYGKKIGCTFSSGLVDTNCLIYIGIEFN